MPEQGVKAVGVYKAGDVPINVTMRRVRVYLPWKSSKYYIF